MEAEAVIDEGAWVHGDWLWGEDSEVQKTGRDALEICRVCEEGEHFLTAAGYPELCFERVRFHRLRGARDLVLGRAERDEWGGTGGVP